MNKVGKLRKKYPEFIYQDYSYKYLKPNLKIWFNFQIKNLSRVRPLTSFKSGIVIRNVLDKKLKVAEDKGLDNLIFHLGLIEMLNYWKLTCSPIIKIEAGRLNREQVFFLRKIILNGMGQYFYENRVDFTEPGFLKIGTSKTRRQFKASNISLNQKKILIPIGGGKDSPATIELLRKKEVQLGSFALNPKKPQLDIIRIAGLKEKILIERRLDKDLFKLNKAGYLNGHVPFSAFLSFLSLVLALLFDYKRVAFSWEKSASEPNLRYKNRWINHQWSKSIKFEKIFYRYSKKYLLKNVEVFSPLRQFSELQISEIFSKLSKYHNAFISCNKGYGVKAGEPRWCCKCPKCLSVFASLYPFMNEKKLIKIFGRNLFKDRRLLPLMLKLIGKRGFKPFECVGARKETLTALHFCLEKDMGKTLDGLPYLLRYLRKKYC